MHAVNTGRNNAERVENQSTRQSRWFCRNVDGPSLSQILYLKIVYSWSVTVVNYARLQGIYACCNPQVSSSTEPTAVWTTQPPTYMVQVGPLSASFVALTQVAPNYTCFEGQSNSNDRDVARFLSTALAQFPQPIKGTMVRVLSAHCINRRARTAVLLIAADDKRHYISWGFGG